MSGPLPQEEAELRSRLRALRVDPLPGDFEAALHRKLAAAGPPPPAGLWERVRGASWRPLLWPAVGITAGLLVVVLSRPAVQPAKDQPVASAADGTDVTRVPASKVAIIRLNLAAEVATENALVRVSLPEGLVFWSQGEALAQRSFSWTQSLAAGDNDIPIAIRGQRPGRYRVAVTAQTGNDAVQDEVVLEVTGG